MKTAIIGLGRMGLRHLQILVERKLDIVAVSDVQGAARENARVEYALRDCAMFADGRELIEAVRPELLVIAATAPPHAELVCLAARNGVKARLGSRRAGGRRQSAPP